MRCEHQRRAQSIKCDRFALFRRSVVVSQCQNIVATQTGSPAKDTDKEEPRRTKTATSLNLTLYTHIPMPTILKQWFLGQPTPTPLPRILLLDGGVSTHMETKGATFAHRELWSSSLLLDDDDNDEGSKTIVAGHKDWLNVGGVNLISTVTYQCHYDPSLWPSTGAVRDEAHMDDLWRHAADLAHQAVTETTTNDRFHGIVASSGCFGGALANGAEYTGDYGNRTLADLQAFHARKLQIMQTLPIDAIALETVPSLEECRALRELFTTGTTMPEMACWISLSCRNGYELNDGTPVTQALQVLEDIPIEAVQAFGFNCCHAKDLPALLEVLTEHYEKHNNRQQRGIVLYPNSGETWNAATEDWQPGTGCTDCHDMAAQLMDCVQQIDNAAAGSGVRIIVGGCCRTTPSTLAALRNRVDAYLKNQRNIG